MFILVEKKFLSSKLIFDEKITEDLLKLIFWPDCLDRILKIWIMVLALVMSAFANNMISLTNNKCDMGVPIRPILIGCQLC